MRTPRLRSKFWATLTIVAAATLGAAAQAAPTFVVSADGKTVTDPLTGLMWLQDANLAKTQHYGGTATGQMNWTQAMNWVAYLNSISYAGYNDWRLWRTFGLPACTGLNCHDSEMAVLFDHLGGVPGVSIYTLHDEDFPLFQNVRGRPGDNPVAYWSQTAVPSNASAHYSYNMLAGDQGAPGNSEPYYGWAVRMPTPGTLPLAMAAALGALALTRRPRAV